MWEKSFELILTALVEQEGYPIIVRRDSIESVDDNGAKLSMRFNDDGSVTLESYTL